MYNYVPPDERVQDHLSRSYEYTITLTLIEKPRFVSFSSLLFSVQEEPNDLPSVSSSAVINLSENTLPRPHPGRRYNHRLHL